MLEFVIYIGAGTFPCAFPGPGISTGAGTFPRAGTVIFPDVKKFNLAFKMGTGFVSVIDLK